VLHSSLTKETAVIHAAGAEEEKVSEEGTGNASIDADPYPGSGIRCLFDPWIWDPGWVKNQCPDQG
jgi:hypothetical protein